jgi:hypothetical protein
VESFRLIIVMLPRLLVEESFHINYLDLPFEKCSSYWLFNSSDGITRVDCIVVKEDL